MLVGKKASYDGSTMIARNDDSGSGSYTAKRFVVVHKDEQPRIYKTAISGLEIKLPDNPMQYTAMPNVIKGDGIWAASGVNEAGVGMTATETITSNERVLGLDPLVRKDSPKKDPLLHFPEKYGEDKEEEGEYTPGGIGEEDIVCLVLPYIHSAREGVQRLGELLEKYGTYEMNGIAFNDVNEIWWLETIGGHHFIARRVPDEAYVVMPNCFGIDKFDFEDALGKQENFICSKDMKEFMAKGHLDLTLKGEFSAREAFGSHDDADHVYNTPRAWFMERYMNPHTYKWDGADADYRPDSDDIPWCLVPERKITVEDVKYLLSSHFQGTPFDPYASYGNDDMKGAYRSIGVNRTDLMTCIQMRPYASKAHAIEWFCFGSNMFNALVPMYTIIDDTPEYFKNTTDEVSTDSFYWTNRLIAALANASFGKSQNHIERYQLSVQSKGRALVVKYDDLIEKAGSDKEIKDICMKANEEIALMVKEETSKTLDKVLYEASNVMKNSYARSDA